MEKRLRLKERDDQAATRTPAPGAAMLQCGWASVRPGGEAVLQEMFERLAPRAGRKRAIVAVTRRLVVRLRARWLDALAEDAVAASAHHVGVRSDHGGSPPHSGRLRHAGWTPPRGGSLDSLAALAAQYGHGALTRATDDNLVAVLTRTRSNNRLAIPRLVSAPSQERRAALRREHGCATTAPHTFDRERHNSPHELAISHNPLVSDVPSHGRPNCR